MILARVAVAKSSRSAASSEDLSGTFYRACRKTAPRTGAVSSLSDLCSPHNAYAPCPLLAEQRLASHRLQPIDTSTAAGKAFLDMLGVFAEFETNLRRERQLEGIAKAKEAGVYKGAARRIDREAVQSLHREGKGPTEIAKALGISRMHAYRLVKVMEAVAGGAAA